MVIMHQWQWMAYDGNGDLMVCRRSREVYADKNDCITDGLRNYDLKIPWDWSIPQLRIITKYPDGTVIREEVYDALQLVPVPNHGLFRNP